MKLDSLVPNAHYDNEHGTPQPIEKDNAVLSCIATTSSRKRAFRKVKRRKFKLALLAVKSVYGNILRKRY